MTAKGKSQASFSNAYYVEFDPGDPQASRHRIPGTIFYGPIVFDPHAAALVTPAFDAAKGQYSGFTIGFLDPKKAYTRATDIGPKFKAHTELVALMTKRRPIVVLTNLEPGERKLLVAPMYGAENFAPEAVDQAKRTKPGRYFFMPACPELKLKESLVDFLDMQAVVIDDAPGKKDPIAHLGTRANGDPKQRFVQMHPDFFARLREAMGVYLGVTPPPKPTKSK